MLSMRGGVGVWLSGLGFGWKLAVKQLLGVGVGVGVVWVWVGGGGGCCVGVYVCACVCLCLKITSVLPPACCLSTKTAFRLPPSFVCVFRAFRPTNTCSLLGHPANALCQSTLPIRSANNKACWGNLPMHSAILEAIWDTLLVGALCQY